MLLIPYDTITYTTRLKEEQVLQKLEAALEPTRTLRSTMFGSVFSKPFNGEITGARFKMSRNINYRNSFRPVIEGEIMKNYTDTSIKIRMRLAWAVLAFLILWCALLGTAAAGSLKVLIFTGHISGHDVIPLGMIIYGYGITVVFFKMESRRITKILKELFDAEIVK